jgi:hypothetical protein
VTTLKEFEEALREQGMLMALALLHKLKERDRATRTIRPARRIAGRKMTPELAREILELNRTTDMTQQEIAFRLGVNQGRVNEVIKRGKWLSDDPASEEAISRDKAKARMERSHRKAAPAQHEKKRAAAGEKERPKGRQRDPAQLSIEDLLATEPSATGQD